MKKGISILLAAAVAAAMVGCSSSSTSTETTSASESAASDAGASESEASAASDKAEFNLKLGTQLAITHPYNTAAQYMADLIEEKTNGKVHIDIFPSSQLGSERELMEGLQVGSVDMCIASGPVASFDSDFYINDLPNLFKNTEHAYAVFDGEIGQKILDGMEEKAQIKALSFWETGWLCMFNDKHPVEKPEDLKGLSMRTMENQAYVDYYTALDCNPVPMAYSEFVSSVSNGTVNGTSSPIVTIYTDKTYEICPYITRGYQWYLPAVLMISDKVWNQFDDETKAVFEECAVLGRDYERQQLSELEDKYLAEIEASGAEVVDCDPSVWAGATDAIEASWKSVVPDKVSQELIDEIKAIGENY